MDMSYLNFCCCLQIMAGVLPVLSALSIFKDETVCYNRLGCFTNKNPWSRTLERPISRLPWAPEKINTRFLLYTRNNLNKPQVVTAVDHSTIATSNFQTHLKSHIIIHGFINSGEDSWLVNMCQGTFFLAFEAFSFFDFELSRRKPGLNILVKDAEHFLPCVTPFTQANEVQNSVTPPCPAHVAMLQVEDVNCFCTDWSGGSQTLYTQAANNIRVVGAEVAYLVNTLLEAFKYPLSKVHIIGHSLGAHAAGEAGKRQPGIGRITGLDPAQPYFQDTPPEVRLDPSDAILVDAIHTDITSTILNLGTGGYGMSQTVGHLDFFPNGGRQMPGCKKNQVISHVNIDDVTPVINELVCCNHMRSYQYYTESIRSPDGFIGFPSSSYDEYLGGAGFPCPSGGCPWMGHYADQYRGITSNTQTFYLNTGERNSFSRWRYMASVQTAGNSKILGNIAISVQGSNGKTSEYTISRGIIMSDKTYTDFIDVEVDIGSISTVTFVWRSSLPNLLRRKLGASIVTLHYGKDRAVTSFCDSETVLDTVFQTLRPCGSTLPV